MDNLVACPVCNRKFQKETIEEHVNKCLFLNTENNSNASSSKRNLPTELMNTPSQKKIKLNSTPSGKLNSNMPLGSYEKKTKDRVNTPLAERMRPVQLDDIVGQMESFGQGSMLRSILEQNKIPNMILWGPPGCGKTSIANVIANLCKSQDHMRFVKLSATVAGINDVKEVIKVAKNEAQFKKQTVLFMDEIHRFNKLQQDTFLPHVENGTITLIGATTENPSFSLNNALISRCRVVVMKKLSVENVNKILEKAIVNNTEALLVDSQNTEPLKNGDFIPRCIIEHSCLQWLSEICDGDARIALGALEMALEASNPGDDIATSGPFLLTLDHIKQGIKRCHMLYDRLGEEHYNTISALQKSIRAGDDNAALYWTTHALHGGEDPLYIARRLVRAACEDIGLGDPNALVEAVACLQGCQHIGMPECDVLLAQCAVRLARANKSTEVYHAMKRCQTLLKEHKGPLPSVPFHLRNAPTKLMKQIGYGKGYNRNNKDISGHSYMPEEFEDLDFFGQNGKGK